MSKNITVVLNSPERARVLKCLSLIEGKPLRTVVSECLSVGIESKSSKYKEQLGILMNILGSSSGEEPGC